MQDDKSADIGIVILAAGASTRLGHSKQLLQHAGKTLIQHSVDAAVQLVAAGVVTVLGASADEISKRTEWHAAQVVINYNWSRGMASSIKCGLQALLHRHPHIQAVLLMLCDQPFVSTQHLNNIVATHLRSGMSIVASRYGYITGVPALFHSTLFPALLLLEGDAGARSLIAQNPHDVAEVAFPQGAVDIDTPADYHTLKQYDSNLSEQGE